MTGPGRNGSAHRATTLRDVARVAGVSVGTASKALNGRRDVGESTRLRVIEAADRLAFSPNALARSLLAQRSGTVGLLTSDLEGRFSIPILMGAEDAFGSDRTSVFLCDARGDKIREQHHLQALLSRRVDGLIIVGARPDVRASLGRDLPVPVVYAYAASNDPQDLSLVTDNVAGGEMAVDHLITYGRRRIAHITGDASYGAAQDRAKGAQARLDRAGLSFAGGQVLFGSWSETWGHGATRQLLKAQPDVDAIFAGSDQIARGVMDALHEANIDVPNRVSVIGFDNWKVLSENSRPPLTTIDMNLERLGRIAAQRLLGAMDGGPTTGVEKVPCRVVPRASTAPAG